VPLVLLSYVPAPFRLPDYDGRHMATAMGVLFLAIMAVGMVAFGCWRAIVGGIAARPISDRLGVAAGLRTVRAASDLSGADFAVLERLFAAAGVLEGAAGDAILIRTYYSAAGAIRRLLPALAPWSEREMTVCSRYLAVRVDRFLATNTACARRVRSL